MVDRSKPRLSMYYAPRRGCAVNTAAGRLASLVLLLLVLLCLSALLGCGSTVAGSGPTESTAAMGQTSSTSSAPEVAGATTVPAGLQAVSVSGTLQVHYIDVGQGDSILIVAPDGKVMLIDGGESGSGTLAYLQAHGVKRIDVMVATHPHADHIGGLVDVLDAMPVGEVITSGVSQTTKTYERFLDGIAAAKAVYKEVKRGDVVSLGALNFAVLHAGGPVGDDLNQTSVVLRLVYGKVAFLFTGDAGKEAEAQMLAEGDTLQAQILKVGHHGSSSASSPEFLDAVKPQVAVYSCGAGNSYGHPAASTIANLAAAGATVYGTDLNGSIVVTTDGNTYRVTTAGQGTPRAPPVGAAASTSRAAVTATTSKSASTSGALAISVLKLTSPIKRGAVATLTVKTTPGANCTITVKYKSGPSHAAGLDPQAAQGDGTATWSWKVGTSTTPGTWSIIVTATANGKTVSKTVAFEVTS